MKFKKIVSLLITTSLLLMLCACSNSTPENTIGSFFSALKKYDVEKLSSVVTEFPNTDDCGVTYDLFSDDAYVSLYQKALVEVSYKIISIEKKDTTATIKLSVDHPDLQNAYSTALYTSAALIFSDEALYQQIMSDPNADISSFVPTQMINLFTSGKIETITTEFTLTLVKSNDTWCISTDDQLKNLMSGNLFTVTSTVAGTAE